MEPQVGMVLDIDCAPIASGRAGSGKRAGANTPAFQWAAVFMCILFGVIAPGDHFMSGPAERVPLFVESNIFRGIVRRLCAAIDIDKGVDVPAFQKAVGCDVVMGGIKADILWEKPVSITPEIINGIKEVPAVMPPCAGEVHQQWEFNLELCIPGTEHIKGMPEIPAFISAVQPPSRIRVGIVAPTAVAERAGVRAGSRVPPIRGGMGRDGCAIAGYSKVFGVNQPRLYGREDSKEEKEFLEGSLRVITGGRAIHNPFYNICSGEGIIIVLYKLAVGSDNLVRLFGVPASRKEAGTGIDIPGSQPETVHEIVVRAKGRQLVGGSTAGQNCKGDRRGKGFPDPYSEAGFRGSPVKEQDKKDKGTEDLGLVLCGTPGSGIKAGDEICNGIKVKAQELAAFLFIGFEAVLWVAGKAFAISPDKGSILVVALP